MSETSVKLDALPSGLEFPPELANRIYFDAAGHRLVYRGFMYKCHYDRLMRLDGSVKYRRAIQRLFQNSTDVDTPQLRQFGRVLMGLVVACLLFVGFAWWQLSRNSPETVPGLLPLASPEDGSSQVTFTGGRRSPPIANGSVGQTQPSGGLAGGRSRQPRGGAE